MRHIFMCTMYSNKLAYDNVRLETLSNMSVLYGTVLEFYNVCGEQNVVPEG